MAAVSFMLRLIYPEEKASCNNIKGKGKIVPVL
jgi:hypothetical protein